MADWPLKRSAPILGYNLEVRILVCGKQPYPVREVKLGSALEICEPSFRNAVFETKECPDNRTPVTIVAPAVRIGDDTRVEISRIFPA